MCKKILKQLSFSTEQAAYISAIACLEAKGDLSALQVAINKGLDAELTVSQVKEALSQLYTPTPTLKIITLNNLFSCVNN